MRILMLVISNVATDTRVMREAAALADAGHAVHVIGKDVSTGYEPPKGVTVGSVGAGSAFRKEGAESLGARRRLPPHLRAARWLLLPQHRNSAFAAWRAKAGQLAAAAEFDVVHAHDFNTLPLGVELARQRGVPLVYDTHELWRGRPRVGRPTPLQKRREARQERDWGARATTVITVGEGVADALREAYGWRHVDVVRNTFPLPEGGPVEPPRTASGAVYAGRIAPFRELEAIAGASELVRPLRIVIAGPADDTYLGSFDGKAAEVVGPRPVDEVDALLRELGISLVTHSDKWLNHRLAMPNKLFHAVRAGVPVVGTDVQELRRVVEEHKLGALYRPGDAASLAAALREVAQNYETYAANVRAAAPALSWEADAAVLRGIYERLAPRGD
ncbi:glycosyltransferase family 4 protein [Catenulispora subtropica]|uniref:Glycosyltransferase subfamily 4-like N-terminal domain-containing protein n=1 Tax=Catenulispora subtropica TaxID=450798 RepID=A0ABP5D0V3_9ACTN